MTTCMRAIRNEGAVHLGGEASEIKVALRSMAAIGFPAVVLLVLEHC